MALYQIVEKQDDARQNDKLEKLPSGKWQIRERLIESSTSMTITMKRLGVLHSPYWYN
jgi:hypothetical protein